MGDGIAAFDFGRFSVRPAERALLVNGEPARLGARAFDLLTALIERRDRTVSKDELLELVWPGLVVEENNLAVHISALRKLLGHQAIATIPGRGYRFTVGMDPLSKAPGEPTAATQAEPGPGNLPAAVPRLYGRDRDVDNLATLLRANRLVTVVGAGGIGKTRVAQAAGHALWQELPDGAWLIELASVSDPGLVPAAVSQALGIAMAGQRNANTEVVEELRGRALLLILDNCEHVVEAVGALIHELMAHAPRIRVLVTSQEVLKVPDEVLYRLAPLDLPSAPTLEDAAASSAVALMVDRVKALQPGFALSEQTAPALCDICHRLDGLPLAIELAAARVPHLGVAGVHERLHERFRVLTGGARLALRRHQTLRGALEWSHGLLDANERAIFRRAGVFVGTFGLKVAQQVLMDDQIDEWMVLDHLAALIDKSLLIAEPGEPPRYRLLESARAFALEKLHEAGETDSTLDKHAHALLASFEQTRAERWTSPFLARLERHMPDIDNLRSALDWASQSQDRAQLHVALAGASAWLWAPAGQSVEGLRRCREAISRIDSTTPPELEARLLTRSALARPRLGTLELAERERVVVLYRGLQDPQSLCTALAQLSVAASLSQKFDLALQALEEALQLQQPTWPIGMRWAPLIARYHYLIASDADVQAIWGVANELMSVAVQSGESYMVQWANGFLVRSAFMVRTDLRTGRIRQAVDRCREWAAAARREKFAKVNLADALLLLGQGLTLLGELDEAEAAVRESRALHLRTGTAPQLLDVIALLAFKRGRISESAIAYGCFKAHARHEGWPIRVRDHEELIAGLRGALSAEQLERLDAQGAAMNHLQAAELALGPSRASDSSV